MRLRSSLALVVSTLISISALAKTAAASPWDGTWRLDLARSSAAAKDGAPRAYRLHFAKGDVIWEIPELGEVVKGPADGTPMAVHRRTPTPGLTLAVKTLGPRELTYEVVKDGKPFGGGRMMLVDDASAWVDLTWGPQGPGFGAELVYVLDRKSKT